MRPGLALLLAVIILLSGTAAAATTEEPAPVPPPPNGARSENIYAALTVPGHPKFDGKPMPLEGRLLVKPGLPYASANQVLIAFNALSSSTRIQFVDLVYESNGTRVPLEKDERFGDQPRVFILGSSLPSPGDALIMQGRFVAEENGRFHVGALVIAFDHQWDKLEVPGGASFELYSYSNIKSANARTGRPFVGLGNDIPGPAPWILLAVVTAILVLGFRPRAVAVTPPMKAIRPASTRPFVGPPRPSVRAPLQGAVRTRRP